MRIPALFAPAAGALSLSLSACATLPDVDLSPPGTLAEATELSREYNNAVTCYVLSATLKRELAKTPRSRTASRDRKDIDLFRQFTQEVHKKSIDVAAVNAVRLGFGENKISGDVATASEVFAVENGDYGLQIAGMLLLCQSYASEKTVERLAARSEELEAEKPARPPVPLGRTIVASLAAPAGF